MNCLKTSSPAQRAPLKKVNKTQKLKQKMLEKKFELDQMTASMERINAEKHNISEEVKKKQEEVDGLWTVMHRMGGEKTELIVNIKKVEYQLRDLRGKLHQIRGEKRSLSLQTKKLQTTIDDMANIIAHFQMKTADLSIEIKNNRSIIEKVSQANKDLNVQIDDIKKAKNEAEKKYEHLMKFALIEEAESVHSHKPVHTEPDVSKQKNKTSHNKITLGPTGLKQAKIALFTCPVVDCGKTYEKKRSYNSHMQRHNNSFACDLCKFTFSQKSDLKRHMQRHSGQKPFTCDICEQKFSQKSHLKTHLKSHERKIKKNLT